MSVTWIVQRRWLGCDPLAGLLHFMLCVSIKLYGLRLKQSFWACFKKNTMCNSPAWPTNTVTFAQQLDWASIDWVMPGRRYLYFFSLVELSKQTEFLLCTIYVSFVTCELSWVNGVRAVCLHSKNKRVSFCVNKSNFRRMTRQTLRWHWINNEWRWMYPQQRCNLQNVIFFFLGHISCFNPMDIVLLLLVWPPGRSFQLDARICNAWRASLLLSKLRWLSLFVEDEEYIPVSTALSSMRLCSRLEKIVFV